MTSEKAVVYFRIYFEIEAPDFWWALNREELEIESAADFVLQMKVFPDDDALPQSFTKWRTNVVWTQVVRLSPELHGTIQKIACGPSFNEAMQSGMLDSSIEGHPRILTFKWMPKDFFSEILRIH